MKDTLALILATLVFSSGFFVTSATAGDPVAGEEKAAEVCQTCHGMDGIGIVPMAANLAGQQDMYLVEQLKAFKTGKRQHEQMNIIANMLSTDDIANVAAWYSSMKISVEMPK